jgi:DNA-binding NarL/FixJ family response regulator
MIVRVGIADDQPLIRTGLRTMIDHAPDLELAGEAEDGVQAVELARRHRPDVMLMDVRMPRLDGIEATRQITADAALTFVRVVVLTTFDLDDYVYAAIRAGASGFLLKDAAPEEVLDAIRVVARGDALLAPSVTRRIIEELASRPDVNRPVAPELDILTDRER